MAARSENRLREVISYFDTDGSKDVFAVESCFKPTFGSQQEKVIARGTAIGDLLFCQSSQNLHNLHTPEVFGDGF
eukprot:765359-Hanusia_phi.AAC.5